MVAADADLITHFYCVGRLRDISVDGDAGGVTELLGQRAATTEPACFKEEVETHESFEFQVSGFELGRVAHQSLQLGTRNSKPET